MDDGSSDHDNALLARLNALKKSNVSFGSTNFLTTPPTPTYPADNLTSRFQKLSGTLGSSAIDGGTDIPIVGSDGAPPSPTIEELLAELGPDDQYTLSANDLDEAQKLLTEAKRALPTQDECEHDVKGSKGPAPIAEPGSEKQKTSSEEEKEDEEDEAKADAFLQQILDEVELEKLHGGELNDHSLLSPKAEEPPSHGTTADSEDVAPSFPSLPTHNLPPPPSLASSSPPKSLFPSAPTSAPVTKQEKPTQKKPHAFSDAEIDSWCVICCDDARVRCQGCAGDLYCWACWKEGHTGPDAGFEEKRHRWVGFGKANGKGTVFDG